MKKISFVKVFAFFFIVFYVHEVFATASALRAPSVGSVASHMSYHSLMDLPSPLPAVKELHLRGLQFDALSSQKFEEVKDIFATAPFQNLRKIDVSRISEQGMLSDQEKKRFKEFFLSFLTNPTLQRLQEIRAEKTGMDLEILKAITKIPADPFIRTSGTVSLYDQSRDAIPINVIARECPALLGRWKKISEISAPTQPARVIFESDPEDEADIYDAFIELDVTTGH